MRQAQACKKQGSRCKIEPPLATPADARKLANNYQNGTSAGASLPPMRIGATAVASPV